MAPIFVLFCNPSNTLAPKRAVVKHADPTRAGSRVLFFTKVDVVYKEIVLNHLLMKSRRSVPMVILTIVYSV